MTIYEMKQERANVVASMREMMDKYDGKEMDGVDKETFGNLETKFDNLTANISREEQQLERERLVGEVDAKSESPVSNRAMDMFGKAIMGKPEDIARYKDEFDGAFTLGNQPQAGYLSAPMEFREELIKELDSEFIFRSLARNIGTIGASQSLGFPQMTARATDAEWVGEIAAAPAEETVAFGLREFKPNRMAKMIKISKTLMNHSNLAPQVLLNEMMYAIGRTQEKAYMTGDGTGKPLGVFVASNSGIPAARDISADNTATELTFDGLMNAKYALKEGYRGNANWIFHNDAILQLAKIKDGEERYIWQPSVVEGTPDRLLNVPVHTSDFCPNTFTTGNYVGIIGDFSYYWIVDADSLEVQVLNELYAVNNQIGYLYNYFGDGAPVLGEAFARVKLA